MSDGRSRREKLEAVVAPNSGATDGERSNAKSLLERLPQHKASRIRNPQLRQEVDEFLRHRAPGHSNGKRRGRPLVSVPNAVRPNGTVVGTLQFGDVLEPGETTGPSRIGAVTTR